MSGTKKLLVFGGASAVVIVLAMCCLATFIPNGSAEQAITSATISNSLQNTPEAIPVIDDSNPLDCIPQNQIEIGKVVKIVDGDTIHVEINGEDYKVRYIGMDTPETGSDGFAEATGFNNLIVMDQEVKLYRDSSETDRYDRLLRYVVVGNTFVNYELVRRGLAEANSYPPDTGCDAMLLQAQQEAQNKQVGMWKVNQPTSTQETVRSAPIILPTEVPLENIMPTQPAVIKNNNCSPYYPDVCIPPSPPDLDCGDIQYRRFKVLSGDPHRFDGDGNGIGCESD